MNEELEKEFYLLRNFVIEDFLNLTIEKIIVCEDFKTKNVIFIYLKIYENNWQKYYLDAGAGFWEDTETKEYENLADIEDCENFAYKDYSKELNVKDKIIHKIYCEPNNENCQIIIEFKNERIILRCIDSKIFESDCEIVKE